METIPNRRAVLEVRDSVPPYYDVDLGLSAFLDVRMKEEREDGGGEEGHAL